MRPATARQLWSELVRLFPDFAEDHTSADLEESERDGRPTLHSVMIPFTQYFGGAQQTLSAHQLKEFGALLSVAVEMEDDLENAVSTCFLEHLRQINGYRTLAPFLSRRARRERMPNIRLEFAHCARPTRKGEAPLLAAQPGRHAGKSPSNHCQGSE